MDQMIESWDLLACTLLFVLRFRGSESPLSCRTCASSLYYQPPCFRITTASDSSQKDDCVIAVNWDLLH